MSKHRSTHKAKAKAARKHRQTPAQKAASLRNLKRARRARRTGYLARKFRGAAPYGSGLGILGKRRPKRCTRCHRLILGGMKGMRSHWKKRHRKRGKR